MKKFFSRLQLSPGFLAFVLVFAYLDSIRGRLAVGREINLYLFTPEAAITAIPFLLLIVVLLRFFFQQIHGERFPLRWAPAIGSFLAGMVAWIVCANLLSLIIALSFATLDRNFTGDVLLMNNFSRGLDFVIYGGFYFAYLLLQKVQQHQQVITSYDQALAESTISQLKHQLNPHFLFNNLNVLDQLIEENPKVASEFLQDFALLYRYALEKSDAKLVSLEEELAFAQNYFRLLRHKYGESYQLQITDQGTNSSLIPPMSLQVLIENAVFHNHGTVDRPLIVHIQVYEDIVVTNELRPFKYKKHSGGRGLENLKKQYALLSEQGMQVRHTTEIFSVILPTIAPSIHD